MTTKNWEDDALSAIYRVVWPAMWTGHRALARAVSGTGQPDRDYAAFDAAYAMLTQGGADEIRRAGIAMPDKDQAVIDVEAERLRDLHGRLLTLGAGPIDIATAEEMMHEIEAELHPALLRAVDRFRRVFISHNMRQQETYAGRARDATLELQTISRKIFFISINASIEAARAGETGRGFQQISTDIRELSKSAEAATRDLSTLVARRA